MSPMNRELGMSVYVITREWAGGWDLYEIYADERSAVLEISRLRENFGMNYTYGLRKWKLVTKNLALPAAA
jgi:hypothetical protein